MKNNIYSNDFQLINAYTDTAASIQKSVKYIDKNSANNIRRKYTLDLEGQKQNVASCIKAGQVDSIIFNKNITKEIFYENLLILYQLK